MHRKKYSLLFITLFSLAVNALADDKSTTEDKGWSGMAGVGPMTFSRYTGGTGMQTWPLPLISANYNEIAYIDPLRANVYLGSTADKKIGWGVAVEPRMGFHASDGARLAGMATRRDSLEGGFNIDWDADIVAISFSYFTDLTRSSNGTSSCLYLYKDLIKGTQWKLGGNVGLDHMSAKVTDYFFGVSANEATSNRPQYQPGSATNFVFGFDGSYKINQRYSMLFGLQATHLNGSAANSPIVETRLSKVGWIGLAFNL
jgi:outer membrane protein